MKEIPLTQGHVALVDDEDFERVSVIKWRVRKKNGALYARAALRRQGGKRPELKMHRFILNAPDGVLVDHKNRNGLDNRRDNLRLASYPQNAANRKPNSLSGFKGVGKIGNKFQAKITANGKSFYLGTFNDAVDAAKAYDVQAKKHFGEFAYLNFPDQQRTQNNNRNKPDLEVHG